VAACCKVLLARGSTSAAQLAQDHAPVRPAAGGVPGQPDAGHDCV
jgi:hypothetical protein